MFPQKKKTSAKVIWLTGLSGAGKTTIAKALHIALLGLGTPSVVLDGDELRQGINRDLGFSEKDRKENIRRASEIAKHITDSGVTVIVALISPYAADRTLARNVFKVNKFYEVFVDTPLEVCKHRDPKGLYAKARHGEIVNFTGLDAPYEVPVQPNLTLRTHGKTVDEMVKLIINQVNLEETST